MSRDNEEFGQFRIRNLETVKSYLNNWKACLDARGIWVIEPHARLFDAIAFSLLNKAFRLSEACVRLVEENFYDEAYGLSRSIFECALILRYLTLDCREIEKRSNNYLNFFHAERVHFLALLRQYTTDTTVLDKIESRVKAEGIETLWGASKPKRINDWKALEDPRLKWWGIVTSKHPLDDELDARCSIHKFYAVDWRASSAMVHCSIRALDNNFAVGSNTYKVGENCRNYFDHSFEPLLSVVAYLYLSVRYTLFGANLDDTGVFDELVDGAIKELRYKKQAQV